MAASSLDYLSVMIEIVSKYVTLSALVHSATLPARKGAVLRREQRFTVKADGKAVSLGLERQRMPLVRRHFGVGTGELFAFALDHPIEAHIVFKRIRPRDVVIIRRRQTVRRRGIGDDGPLTGLALTRAPQCKIGRKVCGQLRQIHDHWFTP